MLLGTTLAVGQEPPRNVEALSSGFDPRSDPLEVKTVREWEEYVAVVKLNGGKEPQTVMLEPQDLTTSEGEALSSWEELDLLSLRAYYDKGKKLLGSKQWAGSSPELQRLRWIEGEASP